VVVEDGAEALERLREDACIDVVLTDFQMPGLTGSDLIREMRERGDRRPVILTSGYGADVVASGQEPPDLVLGKPVRLSELGVALQTLGG
jgi:CheY-like chemotaxis protein